MSFKLLTRGTLNVRGQKVTSAHRQYSDVTTIAMSVREDSATPPAGGRILWASPGRVSPDTQDNLPGLSAAWTGAATPVPRPSCVL